MELIELKGSNGMIVAINPAQVAWIGTRDGDGRTSVAFIGSEGKQTIQLDTPFAQVVTQLRGPSKPN